MRNTVLAAVAVVLFGVSSASATMPSKNSDDVALKSTKETNVVSSCDEPRSGRSGWNWIGCILAGEP